MWTSSPIAFSSAFFSFSSSGSFEVSTWSARLVLLSTSTSPLLARIAPRGATTLVERVRLFFAWARFSAPSRIGRSQRRKKRIPKSATANPPTTAIRSAMRLGRARSSGRRYTALRSQHRRSSRPPHRRLVDQRGPHQAAQPGVDRPAEEEGEGALDQDVAED